MITIFLFGFQFFLLRARAAPANRESATLCNYVDAYPVRVVRVLLVSSLCTERVPVIKANALY